METEKEYMLKIYNNEFKELCRFIGGHSGVIANDVVKAIRSLKTRGEEITNENVYKGVIDTARDWGLMSKESIIFTRVVEYYTWWESLTSKDKKQIREDRNKGEGIDKAFSKDKKEVKEERQYIYENLKCELGKRKVYLGNRKFKVVLRAMMDVKIEGKDINESLEERSKDLDVSYSEVKEVVESIGYKNILNENIRGINTLIR